ncbi:MAG: AAA family ATPase [Agathobaculum desmolans]|uniref:AAA family ATPase n=1 Tax=Agathobaculum desmolans TaxID=39484 RepID=UPI00399408B7
MAQSTSIQIDRLTVTGFGCFADERSWTFGSMTTVTGHNYQGKSTIADAVAYALTGAPFFGGRDPDRLQNEGSPFLRVELSIRTEDGKPHEIRRGRQSGKTFLSVDGTTITQERFAERFGSRDLILSLLNPLYFAEVLGGDGRTLIEQYLPPVPHEAVTERLSGHMRSILGDDRPEMPEIYLKAKRDALRELEKDRLVLEDRMQQTESQREKLQGELAEKKALLTHRCGACAFGKQAGSAGFYGIGCGDRKAQCAVRCRAGRAGGGAPRSSACRTECSTGTGIYLSRHYAAATNAESAAGIVWQI